MKHTFTLLTTLLLAPLATTQGAPPDGAISLGAEQAQKIKPEAAAVARADEPAPKSSAAVSAAKNAPPAAMDPRHKALLQEYCLD